MRLSRRALLGSALAVSAACRRNSQPRDGKLHLRFATYGMEVELAAFRRIINRYQAQRRDIAIDLEQVSYKERAEIDTLLAAGVGPDLFRVQYQDVGRYAPSGALIDLSKHLSKDFGEQFTAPVWTAVQYKGRPYALPHHTDTSAILYNKALFDRLGIRAPQSLEESWHWGEFTDVAHAIKKDGFDYGFAMNWSFGGSFRWLNFLYQHGGCLLKDNYRRPAIPSTDAEETLRWTQSFFHKGLVPASDSAKSSEQGEVLFAKGVVGMYFDVGPHSLKELDVNFPWATTFLPRDKQFAAELGGNAIGVSRDAKDRDAAVDFALFATNEENMRDFVTAGLFLPVRRKLINETLPYAYRPDEMRVHLEQSKTVPLSLARTVTIPEFHRINRVLGDELDAAFTGGQSAEETLQNMAREIERARPEA